MATNMDKDWFWNNWQLQLSGATDKGRYDRGRRYANNGSVISLAVSPGKVKGRVQGSDDEPYRVSIKQATWDDDEWQRAIAVLKQEPLYLSQLLAGQWSFELGDTLEGQRLHLINELDPSDLNCTCDDFWGDTPCKHIVAVWYRFGQMAAADPFQLFALFGRDRDELLPELGLPVPAAAPIPATPSQPVTDLLPPNPQDWWQPGAGLDDFTLQIVPLSGEPPALMRLGQAPFWEGSFAAALRPTYKLVSDETILMLAALLSDEGDED